MHGKGTRPRGSRLPARGRSAGLVAAALGMALVAACGSSASGGGVTGRAASSIAGPGAGIGTQLDAQLKPALLRLPLRDASGDPVELAHLAGKVLVVSDSMTLCQETCPIDTATIVETARDVEKAGLGDQVEFLSITVDPKRDTTQQLAAYRTLYPNPPKDWKLLTGSPSVLDQWWDALGVWRQATPESAIHEPGPTPRSWRTGKELTYDVGHSDEVFFFDGEQHERFVLEGPAHVVDATTLPKRLRSFLDDEGRKNLAQPPQGAWTEHQALRVLSWLTGHRLSATYGS